MRNRLFFLFFISQSSVVAVARCIHAVIRAVLVEFSEGWQRIRYRFFRHPVTEAKSWENFPLKNRKSNHKCAG